MPENKDGGGTLRALPLSYVGVTADGRIRTCDSAPKGKYPLPSHRAPTGTRWSLPRTGKRRTAPTSRAFVPKEGRPDSNRDREGTAAGAPGGASFSYRPRREQRAAPAYGLRISEEVAGASRTGGRAPQYATLLERAFEHFDEETGLLLKQLRPPRRMAVGLAAQLRHGPGDQPDRHGTGPGQARAHPAGGRACEAVPTRPRPAGTAVARGSRYRPHRQGSGTNWAPARRSTSAARRSSQPTYRRPYGAASTTRPSRRA